MQITERLKDIIKEKAKIPAAIGVSILKINIDTINGSVFWIIPDGDLKIQQIRIQKIK